MQPIVQTLISYEVSLGASGDITITGTIDLAGSLLITAGSEVEIYDTTLEVAGSGNQIHIISDGDLALGRASIANGHDSYPDGQRYQQGGLLAAETKIHLQAQGLIAIGSGTQVMVSAENSQILIAAANLDVVGSVYAGARLASDQESIDWTSANSSIDIDVTELATLGGLGVDNATGEQATRGGVLQATGAVEMSVIGGEAETAIVVNGLSSIATDATGGGTLADTSDSTMVLTSDRAVQIYGLLQASDSDSDITVTSTTALLLIDGYLQAAGELTLNGGSDDSGTGVNITALLYQTDEDGNYLDENGDLIDDDGYLINSSGAYVDGDGNVVDINGRVLGGDLVRLSGGTLHTDSGGSVAVSGAGTVVVQGVVGSLDVDESDAVITAVDHVSLSSTAGDLTITGLVNANESISLAGKNLSVLSESAIKLRNQDDVASAALTVNASNIFFVDESATTLDRALVEAAGVIQVNAGSVLVEGIVRTTKADARMLINSVGNIVVTGDVTASGDLDVRAGVGNDWTAAQLIATDVDAADLSGGSVQISGEGSFDADGSLNVAAGSDVSISGESSLTGDTRSVPEPVVTQKATTISVVTGSRQVAAGTMEVPVVSWATTIATRQLGTESVLVGNYYNKMDVTLEPIGFYVTSTQTYRYYFMEGVDYHNENVAWSDFSASTPSSGTMFDELTTDEQVDAVLDYVGYQRLYQLTYDPASAKRYQTLNGNFTETSWTPEWASNPQQIYEFENVPGWEGIYIRMPEGAEADVLQVVDLNGSAEVERTVGYYTDTAVALYTQDKSTLEDTYTNSQTSSTPSWAGNQGNVIYDDDDNSAARWTITAKTGVGSRSYSIKTPQEVIENDSYTLSFSGNNSRTGTRTDQEIDWDGTYYEYSAHNRTANRFARATDTYYTDTANVSHTASTLSVDDKDVGDKYTYNVATYKSVVDVEGYWGDYTTYYSKSNDWWIGSWYEFEWSTLTSQIAGWIDDAQNGGEPGDGGYDYAQCKQWSKNRTLYKDVYAKCQGRDWVDATYKTVVDVAAHWAKTTYTEDWYNYDYNWTSVNHDIVLGAAVGSGGTNAASKKHVFDWTSNSHDIYGSRPRYETYEVQVQTVTSSTVSLWKTEWITAEQTVFVSERVDDSGTAYFTGAFGHVSARSGENMALDAGQDVIINGLVSSLGSGSGVSITAERNMTLEGLVPVDTEAANTLAADAKITAPSSISLTAGGDLTVTSSGLLEVTGDDSADERTITVVAGEDLVYAGPVGQALDTGDVAELPASVSFAVAGNADLSGAVITAVNQITVYSGNDGSGNVVGDIGTQLETTGASSLVQIGAGAAAGSINIEDVSLTAVQRIEMSAPAGAILHKGALITADELEITAGGQVEANTSISTLTADLSGSGDLVVTSDRSLSIANAINPSGAISLTAYGNLVASRVETSGGEDDDDITVTLYASVAVTAPSLTLTSVSASGLGDITISGPSVVVQTSNNTLASDHLDVTVDGSLTLVTAVNSLSGQATGSVDIENSGSGTFTVTELTVADGALAIDHPSGAVVLQSVHLPSTRDSNDVTVTAGSNLELGDLRAGIYHATDTEADGAVITALGDVTLVAGGSISQYGEDVSVDLVADEITLAAQTGITEIDIAANILVAATTTTGDISLTEYDGSGESQPGLLITSVSAGDGSVSISGENSVQALHVIAGNNETGMVTLESRSGNLLVGALDSDGTTLIKPVSLDENEEALEFSYGVSLGAAQMLDTYMFFDADGHLEYRAGGAFNFDLPDNLAADTIVLDSGPALKVEGTFTATERVSLASDTNVYVITGSIKSPSGGEVATVEITARGSLDSTSAVYHEGTGLQKFEKIGNNTTLIYVATSDDDGNPVASSEYKYYDINSAGAPTLNTVVNGTEYQESLETVEGGSIDIESTATINATRLELRASKNIGISKSEDFTLFGFMGGLVGSDPTSERIQLAVEGDLDLLSAYISSSGIVNLQATSITADEGSTVSAGTLEMEAETGIGTAAIPLNTMADTVVGVVTAVGGLYLKEADDVTLSNMLVENGDVHVFAGGQLTATKIQTYADGDIKLQAGTDLFVDLAQTDLIVGTGTPTSNVTLEALGDVNEVTPTDSDVDVIGGTINLNDHDRSVTGVETSVTATIGLAQIDVLPEKSADGTRSVSGDYVIVAPSVPDGALALAVTGNLNVLNLGIDPTQDVDVDFTVGGDLTLGTDLNVGDNTVTLDVSGDLTVSGKITASGLALTATTDVALSDLEVGTLNLNLGSASLLINNATSLVIATGSSAGSLAVTVVGDVTIGDNVVIGGDVSVTSSGKITITDETLEAEYIELVADGGGISGTVDADTISLEANGLIDVHDTNEVTVVSIVQNSAGENVEITAASGLTVGTSSDTETIIDSHGGALNLDAGANDLILYAPIVSGGGTITLRADDDLILNTAAQITGEVGSTAAIILIADHDGNGTGSLTMVDGSLVNAAAGDITVTASENVSVAQLVTTGDVSISSMAGSIIDSGDSGDPDIQSATLVLTAAGSVGAVADPIETDVDGLAVTTGATIDIDNSGEVVLGAVSAGSDVVITGTTITISSDVNTGGGSLVLDATDDIHVNASVVTGGGSVNAWADDDMTFSASGFLATTGGAITLRADDDENNDGSGGEITMADGSSVSAGSGIITVTADGDIELSRLSTTNNGATAIALTSTSGRLLDSGDIDGADIIAAAENAVLTVVTVTGVGELSNAIETDVSTLIASVIGEGDIAISETDAMVASEVETADGSIQISTGDALTVVLVDSSGTDDGTNDIALVSLVGDISTETVTAGYSNDATLSAAGRITEDGVLATGITANELHLSAGGAITADTSVNSLTGVTLGSGNIDIDQTGSITLASVSTHNGSITVDSAGAIVASVVSTGTTDSDANDIALTSSDGGIQLGSIDAGSFGDIQLESAADITDDGNAVTLVTAEHFQATAKGAVFVQTNVDSLAAATTRTGNIVITENDSITLQEIDAYDGSISVEAGGSVVAVDLDAANTDDDTNDIELVSTGGGLTIAVLNAGVQNDVALTAADAVARDAVLTSLITANVLTVSAARGIDLASSVTSTSMTNSGSGDISLIETDSITLTDITAFDGTIYVTADGQITAKNVVSNNTDDGSNHVTLHASAGDLAVTRIDAGSLNNVILKADAGFITEDGTPSIEITANQLFATSAGPITLDTQVAELTLATDDTGVVQLDETDSLLITSAITYNGGVSITAGGELTAILVTSLSGDDQNDIILTTTNGDIVVTTVNAGSEGDVTLVSAGAITEDSVVATLVTADVLVTTANGPVTLDTDVAYITLTTGSTGDVDIDEEDSVTLTSLVIHDGSVTVDTAGAILVQSLVSQTDSQANNIKLTTTTGNILLGEVVGGSGDQLSAYVTTLAGSILVEASDVARLNLVANEAYLVASQHIGTEDDPISTRLNLFESQAGFGNTHLYNEGSVVIGGVVGTHAGVTSGGEIVLTVDGSVTVTETIIATPENPLADGSIVIISLEDSGVGDDISVVVGASLESTYSYIQLLAGDDITIESGSSLVAATTLEIFGDYANNDGLGTTITIDGGIDGSLVHIAGDTENDAITTSILNQDGITVIEGRGASDNLSTTGSNTVNTPVVLYGDLATLILDSSEFRLIEISADQPTAGGDDMIVTTAEMNVVVGGLGSDSITALGISGTGSVNQTISDIVLGDHGHLTFEVDGSVVTVASSDSGIGGSDTIDTQIGLDLVLGGAADDIITTGTDNSGDIARDIVFGDEGTATFDSQGRIDAIESTNTDIGGNDHITTGGGPDIVIAGAAQDTVLTESGDDIVLGDSGQATFNSDLDAGVLAEQIGIVRTINSLAAAIGDNDTITTDEGADIVLGGAEDDAITAYLATEVESDTILGDSGTITFEVDGSIKTLATTDSGVGGSDTIHTQNGADIVIGGTAGDIITTGTDESGDVARDIILGDEGSATFDTEGRLDAIESTNTGTGGNDHITTGGGPDIVLAGTDQDTVLTESGDDIVLGDSGQANFNSDLDTDSSEAQIGILRTINTITPDVGDNDTITTDEGSDIVIGGAKDDSIIAYLATEVESDTVLGDSGAITFEVDGSIKTIATTDSGVGGSDTIHTQNGADIVIGGAAGDIITTGTDESGDTARDIVLGDEGSATFDSQGRIDQIQSTNTDTGGDDHITTGGGHDIVLAGADQDTVLTESGDDIVLGDSGQATFNSDLDAGVLAEQIGILRTINSLTAAIGDNDTITTDEGADIVFGGAKDDSIIAYLATEIESDTILGDSGTITFEVDGSIKTIATTDSGVGGSDTIDSQNGADIVIGGAAGDIITTGTDESGDIARDIVFGDEGSATFDTEGRLDAIESTNTDTGGNDHITTGGGPDIVIAGADQDTVLTESGDDIVLGDSGRATFNSDLDAGVLAEQIGILRTVNSLTAAIGDNDTITTDEGADVVLGGAQDDAITAYLATEVESDTVLGDNGTITFEVDGSIKTIATTDSGIGGTDTIHTQNGADIVIGGTAGDTITTGTDESGDVARDIVLGDEGAATFDTEGRLDGVESTNTGTGGNDHITTGGGPDIVIAGADQDTVLTESGDDIVLGDSGQATFNSDLDTGVLAEQIGILRTINSLAAAIGDNDTITTDEGADVVFGGAKDDLITAGTDENGDTGRDIVLGDAGMASFDVVGRLDSIESTDTGIGGSDEIITGGGPDVVFGGFLDDEIASESGRDVVLGDNGSAQFNDLDAPVRVETVAPLDGGVDTVYAGPQHDFVFGGTAGDVIHGGSEHDVLLGDHGLYDINLPVNQRFRSIFTYNEFAAGRDTIHGEAGDDIILGQQHADWLYGGDDEDDITGGHNFLTDTLSGHDSGDYIEGGGSADVIIGDNGIIERAATDLDPWSWESYPATQNTNTIKLDDVIRSVTRYDNQEQLRFSDADLMHGNDTIYGDQPNVALNPADGHDVAFGQRGDDIIHGGGGDDELIGEIGDDTIHGGHGHDVVLGDTGEVMRDFSDSQTPRVNTNGMWHRDVILSDHATLLDVVSPQDIPDLDTSRRLVEADMLLTAGTYDTADSPKTSANNWETYVLILDVHAAGDDILQGGAGDDLIIGQRGDDTIDGDAGDDYLVGDKASHQASSAHQLPLVFDGLQVFGGGSKQFELTDAGTYVLPPIQLDPEELGLNQLYRTSRGHGNVQSREVDEALHFMQGGLLWQNSSLGARTGYLPILSMIPRASGNQHVLPGNDRMSGGPGSDWIVGDNSRMESQLLTGIAAIDDAVDRLSMELRLATHSMHYLGLDSTTLFELGSESQIEFGNDQIAGSTDLLPDHEHVRSEEMSASALDNMVGDDQHTITAIHRGLPTAGDAMPLAESLLDFLHATRIGVANLEALLYSAHRGVLEAMVSTGPLTASAHTVLNFGNDVIGSTTESGNDSEAAFVTGDSALRLHYLVDGTELAFGNSVYKAADADLSLITGHQAQLESQYRNHVSTHPLLSDGSLKHAVIALLPADRENDLVIGNDTISGSESNDVLVGDFSTYAVPIVNQCTLDRVLNGSTASCLDPDALIQDGAIEVLSHSDRLRLAGAIETSLNEMRKHVDSSAHALSFDLFEEYYEGSSKDAAPLFRHFFYGHRAEGVPSATITAGNDYINGTGGDDVVLGDSESFYTEVVATTIGLTRLVGPEVNTGETTFTNQLSRKWHTNYQQRERFELKDHFVATEPRMAGREGSRGGLDNDYLLGGDGDDILMGQQGQDYVASGPGNDTRYGGTGVDEIPKPDCTTSNTNVCDDPNNVMADGPNRPDHTELERLHQGVLTASQHELLSNPWSPAIIRDTLADPLYRANRQFTTTQTGIGWTTSDESFAESAYRVKTNPVNSRDVTGDAAITSMDALLIVNRLNKSFSYSAVYGGVAVLAKQYLDVSGDGVLTPLDALLVIDLLNNPHDVGEGEPSLSARPGQRSRDSSKLNPSSVTTSPSARRKASQPSDRVSESARMPAPFRSATTAQKRPSFLPQTNGTRAVVTGLRNNSSAATPGRTRR